MTDAPQDLGPVKHDPLPLAALKALRPRQWTKNAFVYAALFFSFNFTVPEQVMRASMGFLAFCLISSTGYVFNDLRDAEADRLHPQKRKRPIASGAVTPGLAWGIMVTCFIGGFGLALAVSPSFAAVALLYFVTTFSYTLIFKNFVILDIMLLAAGFLWRACSSASTNAGAS